MKGGFCPPPSYLGGGPYVLPFEKGGWGVSGGLLSGGGGGGGGGFCLFPNRYCKVTHLIMRFILRGNKSLSF